MGTGETGRTVIVGAGLAGLRIAERLRRLGHGGPITLVGAEPHRPYDRPPLSKALLTRDEDPADDPAQAAPLRNAPYEELGLDLRTGVRATALDPRARTVALDDGGTVGYGRLVIATGLRPRMLPGFEGRGGVHVLRSFEDCLALRAGLRAARRVVVVGGGVLGCEIAAAARALGAEVALVEVLGAPMAAALGPEVGEAVAALHRDRGVAVHCPARVARPEGGRRVTGVALEDGTVLPADLVVVAAGAVPDTGWLEGAGLNLDDGVLCDRTGRASARDVWAAGDVARMPRPSGPGTVRLEHWTAAADTAALVAGNLVAAPGERHELSAVPYFWSDQHGVKIQCLGMPNHGDRLTVVTGAPESARFLGLYSSGGTVTGAVAMNMPGPIARCRKAVGDRAPLDGLLRAAPWDRAAAKPG
ncbi:NAD(P)/FAD-dependent oxidoreductase [Actinomadura algeriensis]|uniref:NADPH-dependent 2,4-dienoyl-CoA reductase/sulfur reductase-like enzyme n=1 Tax=Actinomadura algeriensis TaxID=1679523 RepID=A0ABR9K2M3_9ACTN|nr:FAD-dependent oxidoreductase [Actinomadura algeriensis]MBE1536968.1 NADPH-dependent 2,4-dienoyl-CoA reductase/sulfur reductase-like enzyme [Actinomadura algeriensis]